MTQKQLFESICWVDAVWGSQGGSPHGFVHDGPDSVAPTALPTAFQIFERQYAKMSHSLGNPLAGIRLALELLARKMSLDANQRLIPRMERAVDTLDDLRAQWTALAGGMGRPENAMQSWQDLITRSGFEDVELSDLFVTPSKDPLPVDLLLLALHLLREHVSDNTCEWKLVISPIKGGARLSAFCLSQALSAPSLLRLWHEPCVNENARGGVELLELAYIVEQRLKGHVAYTPLTPQGLAFHLDIPTFV